MMLHENIFGSGAKIYLVQALLAQMLAIPSVWFSLFHWDSHELLLHEILLVELLFVPLVPANNNICEQNWLTMKTNEIDPADIIV